MSNQHAAFVAAASAYFLATLPNAGAEALLSHLTVGAHARLAEDGRRAVAQMGTQQRASGDVLVMFGQAIEREQRRMRSFERFMPEPIDPMLRSRLTDMEKGITSVWTSMGITSSPFVPAAERLRGRAGEDRRVPTRMAAALPDVEIPAALAKLPNARDIVYEMACLVDGKRSISDIRDAVIRGIRRRAAARRRRIFRAPNKGRRGGAALASIKLFCNLSLQLRVFPCSKMRKVG